MSVHSIYKKERHPIKMVRNYPAILLIAENTKLVSRLFYLIRPYIRVDKILVANSALARGLAKLLQNSF